MLLGVAMLERSGQLEDGRRFAAPAQTILEPVGHEVLATLPFAAEEKNQLWIVFAHFFQRLIVIADSC